MLLDEALSPLAGLTHWGPGDLAPPTFSPPGSSSPGGILERAQETWFPTLALLPTCSEAPGRIPSSSSLSLPV